MNVTCDHCKERPAVKTYFAKGVTKSICQRCLNGAPIKNQGKSLNRNAPCPCGSGKKFKKCHGVPILHQTTVTPIPALVDGE